MGVSDVPEYLLITSIDFGSTNSIRPTGTLFSITILAQLSESSIVFFKLIRGQTWSGLNSDEKKSRDDVMNILSKFKVTI